MHTTVSSWGGVMWHLFYGRKDQKMVQKIRTTSQGILVGKEKTETMHGLAKTFSDAGRWKEEKLVSGGTSSFVAFLDGEQEVVVSQRTSNQKGDRGPTPTGKIGVSSVLCDGGVEGRSLGQTGPQRRRAIGLAIWVT